MKWNRVLAVASLMSVTAFAACSDDDDPTGPGGSNPPPAVTNLGSTITDGFDLTVTWDLSEGATSYEVVLSNDDGSLTETVATPTVTFDRVAGGTGYTVSVSAGSPGGTGRTPT